MSRWFFVAVDAPTHAKFVQLSNAALGLWVRAGCWCKQHLTDGFVPEHVLKQCAGTAALAQRLVDAKLWTAERGGWRFHNWTKYQRSREETLARYSSEAQRKRAARSRASVRTQPAVPPESGRTSHTSAIGVRAESGRTSNTVVSDVRAESARRPAGVRSHSRSPDLSISRSHIQKEDLTHLPPQLTLTGHPANVQVGEPSSGGTLGSIDGDDNARAACAWLDAILQETLTVPAKPLGGKWNLAYRQIGGKPRAEWMRVEACLRAEHASERLSARWCTPRHLADHWDDYVRGEPPGRASGIPTNGNRRRGSGPSAVSTAEEFAAERAAERAARGEP